MPLPMQSVWVIWGIGSHVCHEAGEHIPPLAGVFHGGGGECGPSRWLNMTSAVVQVPFMMWFMSMRTNWVLTWMVRCSTSEVRGIHRSRSRAAAWSASAVGR